MEYREKVKDSDVLESSPVKSSRVSAANLSGIKSSTLREGKPTGGGRKKETSSKDHGNQAEKDKDDLKEMEAEWNKLESLGDKANRSNPISEFSGIKTRRQREARSRSASNGDKDNNKIHPDLEGNAGYVTDDSVDKLINEDDQPSKVTSKSSKSKSKSTGPGNKDQGVKESNRDSKEGGSTRVHAGDKDSMHGKESTDNPNPISERKARGLVATLDRTGERIALDISEFESESDREHEALIAASKAKSKPKKKKARITVAGYRRRWITDANGKIVREPPLTISREESEAIDKLPEEERAISSE